MHKWYAATACPGPYLGSKFPYIAAEVNKRINGSTTTAPSNPATPSNDLSKYTDQEFISFDNYLESTTSTSSITTTTTSK